MLRRHEFSEVAKLAIWSHPATPISLACSGFFRISTAFAPYPQEELATQCASLLTWTLLLQPGTPASNTCALHVFDSYLKHTSDAAECQCANSRSGFSSNPVLLKIRCSDPRPLFEPGLYTDIYGMHVGTPYGDESRK